MCLEGRAKAALGLYPRRTPRVTPGCLDEDYARGVAHGISFQNRLWGSGCQLVSVGLEVNPSFIASEAARGVSCLDVVASRRLAFDSVKGALGDEFFPKGFVA